MIVIMIDGSKKHNCEGSFLTSEFPVFVKSTVKWNGYEACYTSLLHVFVCFFGLDSAQCLHVIIAFLSF